MGIFKKTSGSSAPPPPPPPPPPLPTRLPKGSSAGTKLRPQSQPQSRPLPPGSVAVGVETELLIAARNPDPAIRSAEDFSRKFASGYMQTLQKSTDNNHPGMHNAINESFRGVRYSEWSLDTDSTIDVPHPQREPWGLEIISPILLVHANSAWRTHIEMMWEFLKRNCNVFANASCGTHVHMSVAGGYSLNNLKMIAFSVIHFEPAFEALLPIERLRNEYTKSNWIDNKNFAYKNASRTASMDLIELCNDMRSLILLMNPDHEGERDKMFGWNFLNLLQSPQSTIEFRRGAASTSAHNVFMWIEVATSFLKAGMQLGSRENLQRVPPTVGGLKWFLSAAKLPDDVHQRDYLHSFFGSAGDSDAKQPAPVGKLSKDKAKKLKKKKLEDKDRNIMLAKTLKAPYWD